MNCNILLWVRRSSGLQNKLCQVEDIFSSLLILKWQKLLLCSQVDLFVSLMLDSLKILSFYKTECIKSFGIWSNLHAKNHWPCPSHPIPLKNTDASIKNIEGFQDTILTQSKIKFYEVILYSQKVLHFTDLAPCVAIMNFSSLSLVFSIITIIRDIFILKLFFRIIFTICVCALKCVRIPW